MDYPKSVPNIGLIDGHFVDENPVTGQIGSLIPAAWGDAVTQEMLNVIKGAGLVPSEGNVAQLLQAITAISASDYKRSVRCATTGPIALSGLQTIDGIAVKAGDRVLVKNQATAAQNWIYVAAAGAWARAEDANESVECTPGHVVPVQSGTVNALSAWQLSNTAVPTLGTTALTFIIVRGKVATPGTYGKVTVDDQGRVTSGSSPTTLAGFGITDAYEKSEVYPKSGTYNKTETENLIAAAVQSKFVSVSAEKSLTADDLGMVLIDASATGFTVLLPAANTALGVRDVIVRRTDNSVNRLVIGASGADKIKFHTHLRVEGYPFFTLMGAGDWWHLRSDGAGNWWPIARYDNTPVGRPVFETTTAISPGGWGLYHGLIYNRAGWPWLWDHAQASGMLTTEALRVGKEGCWTSGDGVGTFRTPEGRGEFFRMLDELRGVDTGRVGGSWQSDELKAHEHKYGSMHSSSYGLSATGTPGVRPSDTVGYSTSTVGGAETRGRNIAYPGRIKLI